MRNAPGVSRKKRKKRRPTKPTLRFTPYAWAKLLFLRDYGETEIGGFGISATEDLMLIEDVQLVRQTCTAVTVAFEDAAVADYFDEQVDAGRQPEQFARVWIHTHPCESAEPSGTDEDTFARCFGGSDWSIMCIVAVGGQTYARLQFSVGPNASVRIPIAVDYEEPFPASNATSWENEYLETVRSAEPEWWTMQQTPLATGRYLAAEDDWFESLLLQEGYYE